MVYANGIEFTFLDSENQVLFLEERKMLSRVEKLATYEMLHYQLGFIQETIKR